MSNATSPTIFYTPTSLQPSPITTSSPTTSPTNANLLDSSSSFTWSDVYDDSRCQDPVDYGWCAEDSNDPTSYLLADLRGIFVIDSVSTWADITWNDYVESYNLYYSLDNISYTAHSNNPLEGNENWNEEKKHIFQPAIITRYLKFVPLLWNDYKSVEFYIVLLIKLIYNIYMCFVKDENSSDR